ncbi:ISNCY family transposase [Patescibacteria group bacterium]|nr:ISNCY family transposase [Patescibacteria group bacterium]
MERWQLSAKEITKYTVIKDAIKRHLKANQAAEELNLSTRQIFRLKKALREKGLDGIIHGNKGKQSPRRIPDNIRDRMDLLYKGRYVGFNISHFTEMLEEEEGIILSRETVRGILLEKGSYEKRKKQPKHRSWREPKPKEGMMLQYDTSDHDWLEGRGPRIKLIGAIDDATGNVPYAQFAYEDSVEENMATSKKIIQIKGIPLSIYVDRDSKFITTRHQSIHVNLKGNYKETQMGRAWDELGINVIFADSPQAKGRIERLWQTFQDRLISELRLMNISTLEEANEYLHSVFLLKYNQKFTRKPQLEEVAYKPIPEGMDLDHIFCLKEKRQVHGDHTISYKGRKYLILPTKTRFSFAKAKVEVQKRLDGSIHIFYQGEELNYRLIPLRERNYVPSEDDVLAMAGV